MSGKHPRNTNYRPTEEIKSIQESGRKANRWSSVRLTASAAVVLALSVHAPRSGNPIFPGWYAEPGIRMFDHVSRRASPSPRREPVGDPIHDGRILIARAGSAVQQRHT
jgi:hypothetical protein